MIQNKENKRFYSNGKLLLSGEYLVLDGATALAMPVKYGQSLELAQLQNNNLLRWEAYVMNKLWFFVEYNIENLSIIKTNMKSVAEKLIKILKTLLDAHPEFKEKLKARIVTNTNFDNEWGLGTSSTLISNLAYLASTNPYKLLQSVSNGSGYDIAAARQNSAFLFTKLKNSEPEIQEVELNNNYTNNLYFVYLGKKQNSEKEVSNYLRNNSVTSKTISEISSISRAITEAKNTVELNYLLKEHEKIISSIIGQESIQDKFFSDFNGQIKSLGAWGGDFILASTLNDAEYVNDYFKNKGLKTIFHYQDIIIKS